MNAGATRSYRAFISYSHADGVAARWLHRRLEGFVMPARLVGQPGQRGPVPTRLTPIFKDREDLPAAHDLTDEVRAALSASACLIVLCSPAAAASRYVDQEIALFRAEHPDRPILAALWNGEPDQAFPAALRRTARGTIIEPLAADFRKSSDGRRLALLKLVAGIAGVDLDALVQREAQRRLRRVTAVTVFAVIGMLAMGLLTAMAFSARAEAERQRGQAEGLVEFMLTDLRDRLKGVGRLDVLTSANTRALTYYRGVDLDRMSAESLERRARILHALGEDEEVRGRLDTAAGFFAEAARTTGTLLAAAPGDTGRIFPHSQSVYWLGLLDWRRGNSAGARRAWQQYATLAAQLREIEPGKAEWLLEVGYAASNLGTLALRADKDEKTAEARFVESRQAFVAAAALMPGDIDTLRETADADGWLADCRRTVGDWTGALAARKRQAEVLAEISRHDPRDARNQLDQLRNGLGIARIEIATGAARQALARLDGAMPVLAALADPENREVARLATMFGLVRSEARLALGDAGAATAAGVAGCATPATLADSPELDGFCRLLRVRLQQARHDPAAAANLALAMARVKAVQRAPSSRWSIDFDREVAKVSSSVTESRQ